MDLQEGRGSLVRSPRLGFAADLWRPTVLLLVVIAVLYGLFLRAWLLAHVPINSDEAVVGIMARGILSGHFGTFYWGQQYGGAEPYVVAAVFKIVNNGPVGLSGTSALLDAVSAALLAVIVKEATGNARLAALGGALAWVWSYAAVWNSVREYGFRQFALCCGLVLVLCALQVHRGRPGIATYVAMGLFGGLGWWASPEIAYFAVPAGILLLASWDRLWSPHHCDRWQLAPPLLVIGGALLGALPWIYTNLQTGFASLRPGSLPGIPGQGYGYRLSVFFHDMLPIQLGTRSVPGGAWVGGSVVGPIIFGLAAVVVGIAVVRGIYSARHGRRAAPLFAMSVGLITYPFFYAAIPSSGYWNDGRYGIYLPPLVVAVLAVSLAGPALSGSAPLAAVDRPYGGRRRSLWSSGAHRRSSRGDRRRTAVGGIALGVACAGLIAGIALTVFTSEAGGVPDTPRSLLSGWRVPNAAARQVDTDMERDHIRDAYGDYWTAYLLDFLSPGGVAVSPSPLDVVRWPAMAATVAAARDPAWLFFPPDRIAQAEQAFSNPEQGPGNYTQAQFESLLTGRGIGYRVVHLGVLDAVLPARKVTLPAP